MNRRVDVMLPTGRQDRRAWLLLSLTAGITEEIMYRGLLLLAVALMLPAAPDVILHAIVVLGFALAHAYQGWAGVVTTGLMGLVLLLMFIATGSLLPGMLLHVLADARIAFVTPHANR